MGGHIRLIVFQEATAGRGLLETAEVHHVDHAARHATDPAAEAGSRRCPGVPSSGCRADR